MVDEHRVLPSINNAEHRMFAFAPSSSSYMALNLNNEVKRQNKCLAFYVSLIMNQDMHVRFVHNTLVSIVARYRHAYDAQERYVTTVQTRAKHAMLCSVDHVKTKKQRFVAIGVRSFAAFDINRLSRLKRATIVDCNIVRNVGTNHVHNVRNGDVIIAFRTGTINVNRVLTINKHGIHFNN